MRKFLLVLSIVAILSAIPALAQFDLTYNNPPITNGIDTTVASFINSAVASVDVAVMSINNQNIIDALKSRKQAGVNVRMVTEADYYNNTAYQPFYQQLAAVGIPIVKDTDGGGGSGIMHDKFVVVDGNKVLTGSYNFSDTQTTDDKNSIIRINSIALASAYTREFNLMFVNKLFQGQKSASPVTSVNVDGYTVEVYFSPKDGATSKIVNAINTANSNLWFNIFEFADTSISNAMTTRKNAGVTVKGTFDAWRTQSSYSQYQPLLNSGIAAKKDTYTGLLHDKTMAIDGGTTSDPIAIIGSFNWTGAANSSNDENVLIIHNSYAASSIKGNIVYVYNNKAQSDVTVSATSVSADGSGKASLSRTSVNINTFYTSLTETVTPTADLGGGSAQVVIPTGWTATQTSNSSGNGYVSAWIYDSATALKTNLIVTVSGQSATITGIASDRLKNGGTDSLKFNYKNFTTQSTAGTATFLTKTAGAGGTLTNLAAGSPSLTVQ